MAPSLYSTVARPLCFVCGKDGCSCAAARIPAQRTPTVSTRTTIRLTSASVDSVLLVAAQDQREPLGIADDDHLRVGARGEFLRRLDALPFQKLRADPLRHDALEVGHTLRL